MPNVDLTMPTPSGPQVVPPEKIRTNCQCGKSFSMSEASQNESDPKASKYSCPDCGLQALALYAMPGGETHMDVGPSGIMVDAH